MAILLAKVERELEPRIGDQLDNIARCCLKRKVGRKCSSVVEPFLALCARPWVQSLYCKKKTLYHYENSVSLRTSRQCSFSLPSAGSLLEFLKTEEGSKQPLPKLIDFSAQVSLGQC